MYISGECMCTDVVGELALFMRVYQSHNDPRIST